jgi:hypothetical protein
MKKLQQNGIRRALQTMPAAAAALCMTASVVNALASCDTSFTATAGVSCTFTPDVLTVPVYKFGLCQTKPVYNNYGDCQFFLDSTTATDVTVSQGTSFDLGGDTTLDTGTYPYVVQLWGDTLSFNYTHTFTTPQAGADGTQGSFCYSNGNPKPSVPNTATARSMTCTTTAALAAAAEQSTDFQISNFGGSNTLTGGASVSGTYDAYLLATTTSLATITRTVTTNSMGSVTTDTSDGNYIFSVLTLTNPVTISENTTSLDMAVQLEDAMTQEAYFTISSTENAGTWCNNGIADTSGTYACLGNAELGTLGFTFTND